LTVSLRLSRETNQTACIARVFALRSGNNASCQTLRVLSAERRFTANRLKERLTITIVREHAPIKPGRERFKMFQACAQAKALRRCARIAETCFMSNRTEQAKLSIAAERALTLHGSGTVCACRKMTFLATTTRIFEEPTTQPRLAKTQSSFSEVAA
jgi:hypothetical protein